jgi:gluconolactonase
MLSFVSATGALADLIDKDQDFRQIGSGYGFTEGPAWNPVGNYLVFSDIPGDRRWRWSEAKSLSPGPPTRATAWPTRPTAACWSASR